VIPFTIALQEANQFKVDLSCRSNDFFTPPPPPTTTTTKQAALYHQV
jgi:hypothetical protein